MTVAAATTSITRRRFTIDEYHRMAETGILGEGDRVELIEGEIVEKSPISGRHGGCVDALTRIFAPLAGTDARLRVQNGVRFGEATELYPDISIVRERVYGDQLPTAADVLLIVEVSNTTVTSDRDVKLPLYARAGVPQVIQVDLIRDTVFRHTDPDVDGYRVVERFNRGQQISIILLPSLNITFDVNALFSA